MNYMYLFTYSLTQKYICDVSITTLLQCHICVHLTLFMLQHQEKVWSQKSCVLIPNLPFSGHDWVHQHALHFRSQRRDVISVQMYNEQSQGNKEKRTNQTCLLTNMLSGQTASHFMMKTTTTATSATFATTTWSQWKNCSRAWERKKGCSLTRRLRLKVSCICKF